MGERIFSPVPAANVRVALGVAGTVDENEPAHNLREGDFGGYRRYDQQGRKVAGNGNTRMMSFENIRCEEPQLECYDPATSEGGDTGVTNGVSKLIVVATGTGCTDGEYDVVFEPALGSEAKVRVEGGTVEAILYWPGSGHTSVPSATVDVEGCQVELRAVINGHPHPNPNPMPNPNHSPSPSPSVNPYPNQVSRR